MEAYRHGGKRQLKTAYIPGARRKKSAAENEGTLPGGIRQGKRVCKTDSRRFI